MKPPPKLISKQWFPSPPEEGQSMSDSPYFGMVVGACIGLLLLALGSWIWGLFVVILAVTIGVASLKSPAFHRTFAKGCLRFGSLVGQALAYTLLTPLFLIGFTLARGLMWCTGQDPLQLQSRQQRTFWLPSDADARKQKFSKSMFATDPPIYRRGLSLVPLLLLTGGLLVAGELGLRMRGYGDAVLYQNDGLAGFFPAGNQDVTRLGGRVVTNPWGMRAPAFEPAKPAGTFRILLLGDSTLYGGQYIDNEELYARHLQDSLQAHSGRANIEVLNMGVNGWGGFNKLGYVTKFGTRDADLCLVCLPLQDLARPLVQLWDTPYFRADAPPRLAYEEVLYHVNWRQRKKTTQANLAPVDQRVAEGIQAYVELGKKLQELGCEVGFEILPSRPAAIDGEPRVLPSDWLTDLTQQLDAHQLIWNHPVGLFKNTEDKSGLYHDFVHLDVRGHALYADHLRDRVMATGSWQAWHQKQAVQP